MKMLKRNAGVVKEICQLIEKLLDCPVIMKQKSQSFKHCGHDKEAHSGKLGLFCHSAVYLLLKYEWEVYASESRSKPNAFLSKGVQRAGLESLPG